MGDDLNERLKEHFSKADASHAAAEEQKRGSQEKEDALRGKFEQLKKVVIKPAMLQVRDALLARNYPAGIVIEDQRIGEDIDCPYIALHASNDIKHEGVIGTDPMFRISFRWFIGRIEFSATRMLVKGNPQNDFTTNLTLADLTPQTVNDLLLDGIRAMFPIVRASCRDSKTDLPGAL